MLQVGAKNVSAQQLPPKGCLGSRIFRSGFKPNNRFTQSIARGYRNKALGVLSGNDMQTRIRQCNQARELMCILQKSGLPLARHVNGKVLLDRISTFLPERCKGLADFTLIGFPGCARIISLREGFPMSCADMTPTRGFGELLAVGVLKDMRGEVHKLREPLDCSRFLVST